MGPHLVTPEEKSEDSCLKEAGVGWGAGMRRKRKATSHSRGSYASVFFPFPVSSWSQRGDGRDKPWQRDLRGEIGKRRKMRVWVAGQVGRGDLSGLVASVWDLPLRPTLVPALFLAVIYRPELYLWKK